MPLLFRLMVLLCLNEGGFYFYASTNRPNLTAGAILSIEGKEHNSPDGGHSGHHHVYCFSLHHVCQSEYPRRSRCAKGSGDCFNDLDRGAFDHGYGRVCQLSGRVGARNGAERLLCLLCLRRAAPSLDGCTRCRIFFGNFVSPPDHQSCPSGDHPCGSTKSARGHWCWYRTFYCVCRAEGNGADRQRSGHVYYAGACDSADNRAFFVRTGIYRRFDGTECPRGDFAWHHRYDVVVDGARLFTGSAWTV